MLTVRHVSVITAALLAAMLICLSLTAFPADATARANAGVLYVAAAPQGSGDCSSWVNACLLQTALANALDGDEIWVKQGVHYPTTSPNDRNAAFILKSGVAIYGGFSGVETDRDQRDWQANLTILSGDIDHNDLNGDGNFIAETWEDIRGANSYHVLIGSNADGNAVLDGFVVTAGQADWDGGGLYNDHGSFALRRILFSGNLAYGRGGGMCNFESSPTLTEVIFRGNLADSGGGLANIYSSLILTQVVLDGNFAAEDGGGMFNDSSTLTLTNATLSGNDAVSDGGGMFNYYCIPALTNVILWGNTASNGAGIYNDHSTASIAYSDLQDCGSSGSGWNPVCGTDGGGNIEAAPLFVDASRGNLRLQFASPAIDAGRNAALPPDIIADLDGNPRFVNLPTAPDTGDGAPPIVDMGAYETQFVDLVLSKAVTPQEAAPGDAVTFTLTLTNTGSLSASGIVVTDTMPLILQNVSFTSSLVVTETAYLSPYVWLVQDLMPGQSGVIIIRGVLTRPFGVYTNTALLFADDDLLAENNTAVVTFTVLGRWHYLPFVFRN